MKKILSAALLAAIVLLAGCGGVKEEPKAGGSAAQPVATAPGKLKVAFVYVGPVGDGGYSFAHDQGRQQLVKELGDKVDASTYLESVPEGPDAERVLEDLAKKGNKVIFATSFGYMDAIVNVAKKYPDVVFMHCSGYKTDKNLGTYFGRNHEAFYLAGIVAGLNTKNNTIGMVAAYPIPEVIRAINALTMGARSVNPNAKVKVVWTNTWFDPAKEKDAANSLLDAGGADLIAMYQDSPGPLQAAQDHNKLSIGNDSDSKQYAPKSYLTAPVWNWGPEYVKTVKAVLDGTWKSGQYWGGIKDGIVELAPISDLSNPAAKDAVAKAKDKTADVFTGPLKDQSGAVKVPAGHKLTDEELLNWNWFVEGVDGTIPKA